jgi:hypothetical protein
MNCEELREMLTEYIDGRLDAGTTAAVSAHLDQCADCRRLDEELRATVAALGDLETKVPPMDFAQSVTARLERRLLLDAPIEIEKPRRRLKPFPIKGVGLAAAAAILATLYVWHASSQKQVLPATPPSARVANDVQTGAVPAVDQPTVGKPLERQLVAKNADGKAFTTASEQKQVAGSTPAVAGNVTITSSVPSAAPAKPGSGAENDLAYAKGSTLDRKDIQQLKALGYMNGSDASDAAATKQAPKPASPAVGFEYRAGAAPAATADYERAAGLKKAESVAARREVAAAALAATVTTDTMEKAERDSVTREQGAPAHGVTEAKAASPPQSFDIISSQSAVTMAYELVKMLPADKGTPLPQGTLTIDMLRYAAFKRGASVEEASDDKTVIEVPLDPAAIESVHAALVAKAAPKGQESAMFALAEEKESLSDRVAQTAVPASTAKPLPVDVAKSLTDKRTVSYALAAPSAPVRVRFIFERKPSPAK